MEKIKKKNIQDQQNQKKINNYFKKIDQEVKQRKAINIKMKKNTKKKFL